MNTKITGLNLLSQLEETYRPVLEQIGTVNLSKSHKRNWKLQEPTIADLMTHNITPAVFKDRTRQGGADNIDRMLGYMIIDNDGTKEEFEQITGWLRGNDYSYLAWASPSHKEKLKDGLYKMRIIIPTEGLTKGLYPKQFLQLMIDMGREIDIKTDETAKEVTRFFYPPNMSGIQEPKINKDGEWVVLRPKPRNQDQQFALESVTGHVGKVYRAPKRFTAEATAEIEEKQKFAYSDKASVYLSDDMTITHLGEVIGTAGELLRGDVHVRCDCPFEGEHDTSSKEDCAFVSNGHILCSSNTHGNLIGRLESEKPLEFDNLDADGDTGETPEQKPMNKISLFIHGNLYTVIHQKEDEVIVYEKLTRGTVSNHHLKGLNKQGKTNALQGATLIGGIDYRIDLLQDVKTSFEVVAKEDGKSYLKITSNPIKFWVEDKDLVVNQPLLDEYFNVILGGAVEDIIDIVALTLMLKQAKKNNLIVVAPTDTGKTELFKLMNFEEFTGLEWTKAIAGKDMVSEQSSNELKMKGLALIDDFPYIDTINTKTSSDTTKLRVINQGFVEHPTLMKAYTTTDISKVELLADELWNRFMVVVIPDRGLTVPASEFFKEDPIEYRRQTTAALRKMIIKAFSQKADMSKLVSLREKYDTAAHSEVPAMFENVRQEVLDSHELIKFDNGMFGVKGRNIKKTVIKPALMKELDGEFLSDMNKHITDTFAHMFNVKSSGFVRGEKCKSVFYLKDEYQDELHHRESAARVLDMFVDLDMDGL